MKLFKLMLPLLVTLGLTSSLFAVEVENNRREQDGGDMGRGMNARDFDALQDYISSKRNMDLKEKSSHLKISGDVRTEWRNLQETGLRPITKPADGNFSQDDFITDGPYRNLRGGDRVDPYTINKKNLFGLPISRNDFDVEFNLSFKYEYGRNYAAAHLQFDDSCGVSDNGWWDTVEDPAGFHGSGIGDKLSLKRAYWGYHVYEGCGVRFDLEVGRHKLYDIFESEIQFSSRMDGIALYLSGENKERFDWYWTVAGWVVDERVNHFAYGTEVGFLNIMDQGLDVQYSFVHWNKNGKNRFFVRNPVGMRFQTNQLTLTYHFNREWFCGKPAELFGAVIYNSSPRVTSKRFIFKGPGKEYTSYRYISKNADNQKWAWYVGFLIGEVKKEGDWSFETQYQYCQAYSVPDDDSNGLGRGNCLDESLTYQFRGNTNFHGWKFQGLYAITDNLTIDSKLELTRQIKKSIGGKHHYSCFEVEAIYAF